jgi:outer membrane cobalamin receptor
MTSFRRGVVTLFLLACLPALAIPLLPSPASAQTEPAGMLPPLVVTADRFPTDPNRITSSYTVVLQEEMQRRQLRTAG